MATVGILVGFLVAFVVLDVPISLAILLSGLVVFVISGIPLNVVPLRLFNGIQSYELLAVPIFVIMGNVLSEGGLARRLIGFANSIVGFARGGLAMTDVVTSMFMAEMSGAGTADAAVLSRIFVPNMTEQGYERGFAAAVTSAASSLAIIIPPSLTMIFLGLYANMSISQLFLAGLIPGFVLAGFELIVSHLVARARGYPTSGRFKPGDILRGLVESWFVLLIPVVVLGTIFSGIATIVEASEVGLVMTLVGAFWYQHLSLRSVIRLVNDGLRLSAIILLIVAASSLVSWVFANQDVAPAVSSFLTHMHVPGWVILLLIDAFFIVVGTFLHGTASVIIAAPIFLPTIRALGMDPLQYGMMVTLSQAIGQQTPPVASVLLTVSAVTETPLEDILPWLALFLIAFVAVLLLVTFVPWFSTFIPHILGSTG